MSCCSNLISAEVLMPHPSLWGWCCAHSAAGTGHPGDEDPRAVPGTQPARAPALCSSPQPPPPPPHPLGVSAARGAGTPVRWVRGPSSAGAAHGPATVFPVFLSAGGRLCFRLFLSCSAAAAACQFSPPPPPPTGCGVPGHPRLRLCCGTPEGFPGAGEPAVLPSELGIPVASRAVIWLSPDYGAAKALISASLICLKEPVYNNPIKAT